MNKVKWAVTLLELTAEDFANIGIDPDMAPELRQQIIGELKEHYNQTLNFTRTLKAVAYNVLTESRQRAV